jgi:superfamily II DNA or RNA helicase
MTTPLPVTLRKSGTLLEVSMTGRPEPGAELTPPVRCLLEPVLRYQHKRFLYGEERRCSVTGIMQRVAIQMKQLYRYDRYGRMVTGFGFFRRIIDLLRKEGIEPRCLTVRSDREKERDTLRPRAYEYHPELVSRHFEFRARQLDCLDAMAYNPCGVNKATTGFGKMVLIVMACLAFPHAKIHVITKRCVLARKLHAYLTKYLPDIGLVGDGSKDYGRRITVFTSGSLHLASPWDADIILCDEAHELLAEDASMYLAKYEFSRNFAFSATPGGRLDGTDIRMESLFGPIIFNLPYWEAVALELVVPIRVEWCDVFMENNPAADKVDVRKKRWGLWRNAYRNQLIADKARTFSPDDQVMVLVDTVEHAVFLKKHLPEFTLVYAPNEVKKKEMYLHQGLVPEEDLVMTPKKLAAYHADFEAGTLKKVITTGVWAVGIDPVQLKVLVRASSGSSEIMDIQPPGRVCRRVHTVDDLKEQPSLDIKECGIVVDFCDQFDSTFASAAKKRFSHYKAMRWEQFRSAPEGMVPLKGLGYCR